VRPESDTTTGTNAAMEEERDFLIRSLHDLDSERAAGDIDQRDYEALRDDYTVRAAALLRRLEEPRPQPQPAHDPAQEPAPPPTRARRARRARRRWTRWQIAAVAAIVVILAGLVGWQLGHNANHRTAGETITGSNNSANSLSGAEVDQLLTQAESEAESNPIDAIKVYNQILKVYPDQPQALTEQGWIYAQAGLLSQAESLLRRAETASASYDPAHGYLGIVLFGEKNYAGAVSELTYYLAHGPNPALTSQATAALKAATTDEKAIDAPSSTTLVP
jgi:tetratricopeptide (TPR) repeat protein